MPQTKTNQSRTHRRGGKSCPPAHQPKPPPASLPQNNKGKLLQPLLAERCHRDQRQRMGAKSPDPQRLKVGKVACAAANPLSAIKLLDLLKLS